MDYFSISIKGVLEVDGKLLLRKNERGEFELLGGRLEKDDISIEHRLHVEFLEESGIEVEVVEPREPWLYVIGTKDVIIVPFVCRPVNIPEHLFDTDGGTLHWVNFHRLRKIPMPQGYEDTIAGITPRTSYSRPAKIFPNVSEDKYSVVVCVRQGTDVLLCTRLGQGYAPRDCVYAREVCKDAQLAFRSAAVDQAQNTVFLNYDIPIQK